jgi:hypothetical protein
LLRVRLQRGATFHTLSGTVAASVEKDAANAVIQCGAILLADFAVQRHGSINQSNNNEESKEFHPVKKLLNTRIIAQ